MRSLSRAVTVGYLSVLALEAPIFALTYVALRPSTGSALNIVVGSAGLACMVGMHVYSIARRSKALRRVMKLSWWLHLHIFLGLQGILLSYLHCMPLLWRDGYPILVNPGMLNLYALTVVFGSGLFGRYLYAQVPKTVGGRHLAARALDEELASLDQPVPDEVRALWTEMKIASGLLGMLSAAGARRRALAALRRMELQPDVRALAARRVTLESQKAVFATASRIFWLWIVLHRPIAVAMYLITAVHVALGILYTPKLELL